MMDSGAMIAAMKTSGFGYPMVTALLALLATYLLTPLVRKLAFKKGAVDDPKRDDRRIHKEPLPRWGGLAIYAGIVIALGVVLPFAYPMGGAFPAYLLGMVGIGGILVLFGALDDLYQYSAKIQLAVLLGAGVGVQFLYGDVGHNQVGRIQIGSLGIPLSHTSIVLGHGILAVLITAIYIFVVTKTMDTIDGVDGLASGIAAIAASTLVIIAVYGEQPRVALIAAAIAGASIGFLRHNFNPAKIIMGTGGAYILGFMLACISIVGAFKTAAAIALIVPVFVFGVPLFDAAQVMVRRKLSGVPLTQADKRHVHHQLLNKGLTQRQTVLVLYATALILCGVLLIFIKNYG